jgi:hypothetical protein
MFNKKTENEQDNQTAKVDVESERQSPGWVQKYLDLADLLMRRLKEKRDHDHRKAA